MYMKKQFKISDEKIKEMYLSGSSLSDIARVAQDTKGLMALRSRLQSLGVNTNPPRTKYKYKISEACRTYTLNEHFFDNINTEEKAYWLGFLCADGYNHESKTCVAVRVAEEDINHLQKLKEALNYTGPIYTYSRVTRVSNLHRNYVELNICSPILSEALSSHGCIQNKTYQLEFPNIDTSLYRHFIRGYFDGDGCISITQRKDRPIGSMQYQFNIVGKESVILQMQNIICANTEVKQTIIRNRKGCFAKTISWTGKNVCYKILKYLYQNSTIYLERKYNKYLQFGNPVE